MNWHSLIKVKITCKLCPFRYKSKKATMRDLKSTSIRIFSSSKTNRSLLTSSFWLPRIKLSTKNRCLSSSSKLLTALTCRRTLSTPITFNNCNHLEYSIKLGFKICKVRLRAIIICNKSPNSKSWKINWSPILRETRAILSTNVKIRKLLARISSIRFRIYSCSSRFNRG